MPMAGRLAASVLLFSFRGGSVGPVLVQVLWGEEQLRQTRQVALILVSPLGRVPWARVVDLARVAPLTGVARC
jgi:hypothetical protein